MPRRGALSPPILGVSDELFVAFWPKIPVRKCHKICNIHKIQYVVKYANMRLDFNLHNLITILNLIANYPRETKCIIKQILVLDNVSGSINRFKHWTC